MKECFKDSDVAQRYGAARTKTTCIINRAIAPYLHDELVKKMRNRPYTLSTDGSNDTGREKMNPLTVKLFDVDRVEHMFLDMCITTGTNAATAETIFEKMDSVLKKDNIPWQNFHNNASAAGTHYIELSDFDVEDMVVDIGYWFKASTKRKCRLDEFCVFCDTEYMAVIDHVSTRWLSLETAVIHILRLYRALVSYFKSNNVERHIESESHQRKVKAVEQSQQITKFTVNTAPKVDNMTQLEAKAQRAEIKVAVTMVNHNVPLAVADHFSPLIKECFKDSDVAQRYGAARTKTTCIINRAIAPYLHDELVKKMRNRPYTLSTDGSNDTGREKMNPLTVKLFDVDRVEHMFLDMCITTGTNAATAETIFEKMDSVLKKDNIPWQNRHSLLVDNANVNMGVCNSIKSRILSINPTVYVHGCPCHIVHNNASAAGTHYIELSDFDVEDMVVDIGYWFKASTKRKCRLDEFCVFCDTEYMAVIDHVSTRWLSLETTVVRILRLYRALVSYFKSNREY
ncbi:UNVERIFIED_CONTAM: hypothetical protein FKN15_041695 [Acipenser sinensis]